MAEDKEPERVLFNFSSVTLLWDGAFSLLPLLEQAGRVNFI